MKLILTEHGTAELIDDDDVQIWSSDNDPDFDEEFEDMDFINDEDAEDILDYLVDNEYLSEEESEDTEIEVATLDDSEEDDDANVSWPEILDS